jgi:hypothetical protein
VALWLNVHRLYTNCDRFPGVSVAKTLSPVVTSGHGVGSITVEASPKGAVSHKNLHQSISQLSSTAKCTSAVNTFPRA